MLQQAKDRDQGQVSTSKVDSAEEDNKMNSKKSYNDPNDPQNILSQSLRDLVNNQIEENNFHTGQNDESNTNPNS